MLLKIKLRKESPRGFPIETGWRVKWPSTDGYFYRNTSIDYWKTQLNKNLTSKINDAFYIRRHLYNLATAKAVI